MKLKEARIQIGLPFSQEGYELKFWEHKSKIINEQGESRYSYTITDATGSCVIDPHKDGEVEHPTTPRYETIEAVKAEGFSKLSELVGKRDKGQATITEGQ